MPRSGSTYITQCIMKYTGKEHIEPPLGPIIRGDESTYVDDISKLHSGNMVMKGHPMQLFRNELKYKQNLVKEMLAGDYYIIAGLRRNLFEEFLSKCVRQMTGEYHAPFSYDETARFEIPDRIFEIEARRVKNQLNTLLRAADRYNFQFDEVYYYEDFIGMPHMDFAKLKLCPLRNNMLNRHTVHNKKAPDKRTIVTNYDELRQKFSDYIANNEYDSRITIDGYMIKHIDFGDRLK